MSVGTLHEDILSSDVSMNETCLVKRKHMLLDLVANHAQLSVAKDLQARYPVRFLEEFHHDDRPATGQHIATEQRGSAVFCCGREMSLFRVCSNELDEDSLLVVDVLADEEKLSSVDPAKVLIFASLSWRGNGIVLRDPREAGVRI